MNHTRKAVRWGAVALTLLVIAGALRIWAAWVTTLPLDVPVALDQSVVIDQPIEMRTAEFDTLLLTFSAPEGFPDDLRKLIGGPVWENHQWVDYPGLPFQFRWSVKAADGTVVKEATSDAGRIISATADEIVREVTKIPLPDGDYRFHAELVQPQGQYANVPVRLSLTATEKGSTWKTGLAWWGAIGTIFLGIPLILVTGFVALYHYARRNRVD